jgi:pyruvate/2-oxoglutarate/acetoin dehydrogenase E1 component
VHEANTTGGFGGEVIVRALEAGVLSGVPLRVGAHDSRMPATPELAAALIPGVERIYAELKQFAAD